MDPIADMLTRIRNAQAVRKETVVFPFSRLKYEVAEIMNRFKCGYIIGNGEGKMLSVLRKEYAAFLNGDRFSLDCTITSEFSSNKMVSNVVPLIS